MPFLTFIVAFAVMSSGIASASTLSRAFAGDYLKEFVDIPLVVAAIGFILLVAAINARGIAESIGINVVLTAIEVTGLVLIVAIGVAALGEGSGDFSRNFEFREGESVVAVIVGGTALAFYAMIGFEDSVNVAEETREPSRSYPPALFGGIAIAGVLYLLVTLTASTVVPTGSLSGSDAPLLEVVEQGPLGLIVDTASDDAATFARAGILLAVGVALWLVNRLLAGPPEPMEAERLRGLSFG
jgi:APA family basic amino acid/polyamine antiporter